MWWALLGYYRQPGLEALTERFFFLLVGLPWLLLLQRLALFRSPAKTLTRLVLIAFFLDRLLVDYVFWLPAFAGAAGVWAALQARRRPPENPSAPSAGDPLWWLVGGGMAAALAAHWAGQWEPVAWAVLLFVTAALFLPRELVDPQPERRRAVPLMVLAGAAYVLLLGAVEYLTWDNFLQLVATGIVGWVGLHFAMWRQRQGSTQHPSVTGRLLVVGVSVVYGTLCTLLLAEIYFRHIYDASDVNATIRTSVHWASRHVRLNSWGYRDGEFPPLDHLGSGERVVVIGDSFAFGSGIDEDADRLGPQLERELRRRTGSPSLRVMTLSRRGINTRREIELFQADGFRLRPRVVVLAYHINDIDEPGIRGSPPGPLFRIWNPLLRSSDFIEFLAWRIFERGWFGHTAESNTSVMAYQDEAAWARQRGDLLEFMRVVRDAGAQPVVALFPFLHFATEQGAQRLALDLVARVLAAEQVPFVDVSRVLNVTDRKYHVNPFDPHPNAKLFHELVPLLAEEVAAALREPTTLRQTTAGAN